LQERRTKKFHTVSLYREEELVATFTIPWTDPRFVKGDDLVQIAFEKTKTRPHQRWNDIQIPGGWDLLRVNWAFGSYACDRFGHAVHKFA